MKTQTDKQNLIERKRNLLSALLSREVTPEAFKEKVKEGGLPTRVLSLKEEWQCEMEFSGRTAVVHIGHEKYTCQEILDRFEELEAQIAGHKGFFRVDIFPILDPDSVMSKIFNEELSKEEHQQIIRAHCERWGKPYPNELS